MRKYYLFLRKCKPKGYADSLTICYESKPLAWRKLLAKFREDHPEYNDKLIAAVFDDTTKQHLGVPDEE